mmetsp:Transcript_32867/g.69155  ORF Transcript_32867/g.69155 Transcript_32867/m.69155 type:complete len:205 (+) Transcript_32867:209-823(+)
MHSPLSQSKHTSLGTDRLTLCTTRIHHLLSNRVQINIPQQIHSARVNLHNRHTILGIGIGEFNLTIDTARTEQRRIQNINTIRGHDHLNVLGGFKPIQLIQQLQHGTLNLRVTSPSSSTPPTLTNGVNLIHKDDTRSSLTRHDEQFTNHAGSLPNVLLYELGTAHADEGTIGVMRHGTCQKSLTRPWRAVQKHSLRLRDSQAFE